jgi:hypothetical protein
VTSPQARPGDQKPDRALEACEPDHLPPLREPDLVLATITRTLARVTS